MHGLLNFNSVIARIVICDVESERSGKKQRDCGSVMALVIKP